MTAKRFEIGGLTVIPVVTSRFRLDGGSMFGVVPKTLWGADAPADERNRIALSVNSLVVKTPESVVLVEPGMGQKYDEKRRDIYALENLEATSAIERAGVAAGDIDIVVLTHLHLDHAGGATRLDGHGSPVGAFPGAEFVVQESEWEAANVPLPIERGSYRSEDFTPLEEEGRLLKVHGDTQITPGISVELTGGHTRGHQVVRMSSGGDEGIYLGDIVPTAAHLRLNWLMAWDLEPGAVYDAKERLLLDAAERGLTCFFPHDPRIAGCRIEPAGRGRYRVLEDTVIEAV